MKVKHGQKDKVSGISQQPLELVTRNYFYDVLGSDVLPLKQTPADRYYQVLSDFNSNSAKEK